MPAQYDLGELYRARDRSEWYWRALGTVSASLVLLGFLVFPTSFPSSNSNQTSQGTLSVVSVILLALGYSLSVALWFICQSWLFQFDVLFVPCLFSCVFGAINVGISLGSHPPTPSTGTENSQWSPAPISALALGIASSVIYAVLCIFTWRRIHRAQRRGISLSRSNTSTTRTGGAPSHDTGGERAGLIDHEDSQRKAWARLLTPRLGEVGAAAGTNTYRVDIPDEVRLGNHTPIKTPNTADTSTTLLEHGFPSGTATAAGTAATTASHIDKNDLFGGETHLDYGQAVPLTQLTPTAAALQHARERTLHNERSQARLKSGLSHGPVSQYNNSGGQSGTSSRPAENERNGGGGGGTTNPRSAGTKEQRYQGAVHRPEDDAAPAYHVDGATHPALYREGTTEYAGNAHGGYAADAQVYGSHTLGVSNDYNTAAGSSAGDIHPEEEPSFEVVNVPDFQVPLHTIRRQPDSGTLTVGGKRDLPNPPLTPRELEARMADGDRGGGSRRR